MAKFDRSFWFKVVARAFIVSIVALAGASGAWVYDVREMRAHAEFCDAAVSEMPETIPEHLVFTVVDEAGNPLDIDSNGMRPVFDQVPSYYAFGHRIHFNAAPEKPIDEVVHHARVMVYDQSEIVPGLWLHPSPQGNLCGNTLEVEALDDSEFFAFVIAHELGHFLGLSHLQQTLMLHPNNKWQEVDEPFIACQLEILEQWNDIGGTYTPRWGFDHCQDEPEGIWDWLVRPFKH